jgi:hypothetical protein
MLPDEAYKHDLLMQLEVLKAKVLLATSYEQWSGIAQQMAFVQEELWTKMHPA